MSQTVTLILDLLIAGLLVATIVYAIQLNRQLIRLRESRSEMEGLIRSFNEATARAESGIKSMRRTAAETGEGLQKSVDRAQSLRDELQFLVEAADSLARRLAEAPTQGRGGAQAAPAPRRPPPMAEDGGDSPRGRAEDPRGRAQELLRVLTQEPQRGHHPEPRSRGALTRGDSPPSRAPRLPDVDEGLDLPRGRGVLTRGEPASRGARLSDLLDTSQDLPRGRGVLTRDDAFAEPSARAETGRSEMGRSEMGRSNLPDTGRRAAPEPGRGERRSDPARRDAGDGLSRAERELLQAIESRR